MADEKIQFNREKFAQNLKKRKAEIGDLRLSSAESRNVVELDQTKMGRLSRMDALQSQAMSLESERRRQLELEKIEMTLNRLQSGNFGYCLKCDEEIQVKRLELDPTVTLCIDCASNK
ncbi:TraR/DksA family transcriptional regulator [Kiloniella antarctica]|uniref:TraR/DksA family transcriptional regulator n=1 Tax=Kiloniella antarctica TaxID=1550907 RepID=A0ABW5BNK3_9PROT